MIASVVLGLGPSEPDPNAAVDVSGDGDENVTVELQSLDDNTDAIVVVDDSGEPVEGDDGNYVLTVSGDSQEYNTTNPGSGDYVVHAVEVDDPDDSEEIGEQVDDHAILEEFGVDT